ncbi:MAG: hypothetical protein AAFW70_18410 [Cyanobacteria bacterium J06635_10]
MLQVTYLLKFFSEKYSSIKLIAVLVSSNINGDGEVGRWGVLHNGNAGEKSTPRFTSPTIKNVPVAAIPI